MSIATNFSKSKFLKSVYPYTLTYQFRKNPFLRISETTGIRRFTTEEFGVNANDPDHLAASTIRNGEFKDVDQKPIDPVFLEPQRIPPTYGHIVCQLHFRSYLPGPMDFFVDFSRRVAHALKMPCSGSIPLPTRTSRWTVIRGPFVHKKSQENFERKTHKRLLTIRDTDREVVERWLWYLTRNCPAGVGMKVTLWEWEKLRVGKEMKVTESMEGMDAQDVVVKVAEALVKEIEKDLINDVESSDKS
ncbi:17051_t:CDS:2 [Acaulospora morrowiae]|uniref:Small ribosomal subunit protein uS10m n=1 Tax=Acaulospora morrowiae TaxID=94023 RepID=A0A9N9ACX4_9GLOM|nr:17051_t:CDS:2 [Acaulospora morrowiae]